MVMPFLVQDGAILADYRSEAECSLLAKGKHAKADKGKHEKRCSFLERKGDRRSRWIVDSTLFE